MSKRAAKRSRGARDVRSAADSAAERRKDRVATIAAILGFLVIVGGAVGYVASKGGSGAGATAASVTATLPPPPPPTGVVPAQIAANLAQANRVIDTPVAGKLAALHGVPIVVNQWASWCPNCKAEFPFFQRESQRYDRQVAFVGLDAQDKRADAESFLKGFPVNYPSIFDESAQQSASLGGGRGWPTTMFFDRSGKPTFVHEGGYPTQALLDQDIRRYALGA